MGGMRVLEWAVGQRERVARAVVISVGAQATAEEIALCHVQMRAIRADPKWRGGDYYDAEPGDGPHEGLAIARGIGHISYRTELELAARFGRDHQPGEEPFVGGRYAVESYLDYQGDKLVRRFDANSYLVLSAGDEPPRRRPRSGRHRRRARHGHRRRHASRACRRTGSTRCACSRSSAS